MPVECQTCCVESVVPHINETGIQAWANMGYVGFVRIDSPTLSQVLGTHVLGQTLRVTDFGMGLTQDIDKPDVIDGRIDRTVYRLGPRLVEGTMSMPVIVDTYSEGDCPSQADVVLEGENSDAGRMILLMWCWATARDPEGRMAYNDVDLNVRYANHAAFGYKNSLVNELTIRAAQGEMITMDVTAFARARIVLNADPATAASGNGEPQITPFLSPARVLTWNDVSITGITGCSGLDPGNIHNPLFFSNTVRNWELTIANNLDRFFTMNGSLYPTDINAQVRDVTGNLELMGLSNTLREHTSGDGFVSGLQSHFTEKNELRFCFYIGNETYGGGNTFTKRDWLEDVPEGNPIFSRRLMAVLFEIEEMSLTNELYVTTVNYHALAIDSDDDPLYEFVNPSTSVFPVWQ